MDDSNVEILAPGALEQNISGVEIVEGGGALNDQEWTALLAAQAADEGLIQYVCPEIKLKHLGAKFLSLMKGNDPIDWVVQGPPGVKMCPILGIEMEYGFVLDNCPEPVSEQYIDTVYFEANKLFVENKGFHSHAHHDNLERAIKLLRNPFTNLPVESMVFVRCI
jgi:hypothetical protein